MLRKVQLDDCPIPLQQWKRHISLCLVDAQVEASIESLLARQQHLQGQREQLCRKITLNSRAPKADWQGTFAWDQEVDHLLHSRFALQNFRYNSAGALPKHMHTSVHLQSNHKLWRPSMKKQHHLHRRPSYRHTRQTWSQPIDLCIQFPKAACLDLILP